MSNKDVFEELREYGDKLGSVLESLHKATNSDKDTAASPREIVFQDNKLTLYHYLPTTTVKKNAPPMLIVYALVNRPTILDLQQGQSAIEKMLDNGLDVYLIDWGYPDRSDSDLDLNDYVNRQIHQCVEAVSEKHQQDAITLLGVCQGGVLSLCYSSLHPEKVKNLVLMVTPIDFQTKDDCLSHWVKNIDVDLMVDTLGNIPGSMLSNTFLSMKPFQLQMKKYLDLVEGIDETDARHEKVANFMSMEEWIFDSPDQSGEMFRSFIKSCYQQNKLIKGELEIEGQKVDLTRLKMPILNVYAKQDHLVPPAASKALKGVVKSEGYEEMPVPGGHIGIFVSKKSLNNLFPAISEWVKARS